jgi:hypothetical protein
MNRYGYVKDSDTGYPLAAWIWGHRLRLGQHWMEYFLEFLNVLAGFNYSLGQGISNDLRANSDSEQLGYKRFTRLGLRRFIFYDEYEITRDPHDDEAMRQLREKLQQDGPIQTDGSDREAFDLTKTLLQAFSAVEEQRSWYAKSLFPAHHSLLFWEALRKGATKFTRRSNAAGFPAEQLDNGIEFDARNFFARGGELYYLMLSAGTQHAPERGVHIADQLRRLLNERNQALGMLAKTVDEMWQLLKDTPEEVKEGHLGWIVDPNCGFYQVIAEDVDTLLQAKLDPLETLDLLAHLIGFHLTLYIYHRASPAFAGSHNNSKCLDTCRLNLLVDAIEGVDGSIIRSVSTTMLREQETRISQAAQQFVLDYIRGWSQDANIEELPEEAEEIFGISRLRTHRSGFTKEVQELITRLNEQTITPEQFLEEYGTALLKILMVDFKKNFLGVHRKLAKSIEFVAPRKGIAARYVLGSNLLKALTLANLPVGAELTYDEFVGRLYQRYGLIIGPLEAKESGLFERHRINTEYYDRNRLALLEKMKRAGLAVEYSDATAMVVHHSRA